MKQTFKKGDRVVVVFHEKNYKVPVGSTGTILEDHKSHLHFVVMDDKSLNIHKTPSDEFPTAHILFAAELELLKLDKDSLEYTKTKLLRYSDFWGGDISTAAEINAATSADELSKLIDEHADHLEAQLSDALSHLSRFKQSLPFLNKG